jgi:hypothetical protein
MRLREHVVEGRVVELGIETELLGVASEERLAGIGDGNDLDVSAMQVVLEEPFDVAVDETDDGDAEGLRAGRMRGTSMDLGRPNSRSPGG